MFDEAETDIAGSEIGLPGQGGNAGSAPKVSRYSACARRALEEANALAASSEDATMTCEHLLLAMASDRESAAARVLDSIGLGHDVIHHRIQFVLGSHEPRDQRGEATVSPRIERVLTAAAAEAGRRNASQIDTLHLLVAMLRERRGVAIFALETPGLGLERIGGAIMRAFREGIVDPS